MFRSARLTLAREIIRTIIIYCYQLVFLTGRRLRSLNLDRSAEEAAFLESVLGIEPGTSAASFLFVPSARGASSSARETAPRVILSTISSISLDAFSVTTRDPIGILFRAPSVSFAVILSGDPWQRTEMSFQGPLSKMASRVLRSSA